MSDSSQPLLEARDVSKSVDGPEGTLDILDQVSLQIFAGESFAIVGASGSGKTTLLGLLAGLDTPSSGSIVLDGHALQTLDEEARADLRRRLWPRSQAAPRQHQDFTAVLDAKAPDAISARLAAIVTPRAVTSLANLRALADLDDPRLAAWAIDALCLSNSRMWPASAPRQP